MDPFDEEFTCPVCRDMMVEPTTLPCGHNLCYLCLARFCVTSGRRTCPTCQQPWTGHPTRNLALRNMIARIHASYLAERQQRVLSDADNQAALRRFNAALNTEEERLRKEEEQRRNNEVFTALLGFAIIVAVLILILYLLHFWYVTAFYPGDPVKEKPVMTWRVDDVAVWMDRLGWTKEYLPRVHEHQIDGAMLLGLEDSELWQLLNMTNAVQQNALQLATLTLRQSGLKMPETLWEYVDLYPIRFYTLMLTFNFWPRGCLVLTYFLCYDEVLVPFVHATTPPMRERQSEGSRWGKLPEPTTTQWIMFGLTSLLLPQWNVLAFSWAYKWQHYFIVTFIVLRSIMETFDDTNSFLELVVRRNVGYWQAYKKRRSAHFKGYVIFLLVTPILPVFAIKLLVCLGAAIVILASGWGGWEMWKKAVPTLYTLIGSVRHLLGRPH